MEGLQTAAAARFRERRFRDRSPQLMVFDRVQGSTVTAWKCVKDVDLLRRASESRKPSECLLVWLERNHDDGILEIDVTLFRQLASAFKIDAYLQDLCFQQLVCFTTYTDGKDVTSTYLYTQRVQICWTWNESTRSAQGFAIGGFAQHTYDNAEESILAKVLSHHQGMLDSGLGLLWISSMELLDVIHNRLEWQHDLVHKIEQRTGYGMFEAEHNMGERQIGRLARWSQEMAYVGATLADIKRLCLILDQVCEELAQAETQYEQNDDGNNHQRPLRYRFGDQTAVGLIKRQSKAEFLRAQYLSERAQTQISALFNLISQEETYISLRLSSNMARDSNAMKTIALMTMLFLPGTFFAAFFSMPLIDEAWIEKRKLWLYWLITVLSTAVILVVWGYHTQFDSMMFWYGRLQHWRQKRKANKKSQNEAEKGRAPGLSTPNGSHSILPSHSRNSKQAARLTSSAADDSLSQEDKDPPLAHTKVAGGTTTGDAGSIAHLVKRTTFPGHGDERGGIDSIKQNTMRKPRGLQGLQSSKTV